MYKAKCHLTLPAGFVAKAKRKDGKEWGFASEDVAFKSEVWFSMPPLKGSTLNFDLLPVSVECVVDDVDFDGDSDMMIAFVKLSLAPGYLRNKDPSEVLESLRVNRWR